MLHILSTLWDAKTDSSEIFQCDSMDKETRKHINGLELRAARLVLLHRGRLPQQTQFAEVGLQIGQHRVLESLLNTAGLAHPGCLHMQ